ALISFDACGGAALGRERPERVDELRPAGVVERDVEEEAGPAGSLFERLADRAAWAVWQLLAPAQEADPDALFAELRGLAPDRLLQQPKEPADLVVGAGPVL